MEKGDQTQRTDASHCTKIFINESVCMNGMQQHKFLLKYDHHDRISVKERK